MKPKIPEISFPFETKTPFEELLLAFHKEDMIEFVRLNPDALEEAIELAVSNIQPFAWRSAWLIWSCITPDDPRVKPHVKKLLAYIPLAQDNQKRELIKILLMMNLSKKQGAALSAISIELWKDITKDPSIRLTALKMLIKVSGKKDKNKNELLNLADENLLNTLSPGARKAAINLLKQVL